MAFAQDRKVVQCLNLTPITLSCGTALGGLTPPSEQLAAGQCSEMIKTVTSSRAGERQGGDGIHGIL